MNRPETYNKAVETIKTAILQGQYEAAKGVNRIQLAVYFGIGKYISLNTRKGKWGTGALESISQQLRKELPGLRGFSATQLREMRLFYEAWIILDPNSSVMTDELQIIDKQITTNSSVKTDECSYAQLYFWRTHDQKGIDLGHLHLTFSLLFLPIRHSPPASTSLIGSQHVTRQWLEGSNLSLTAKRHISDGKTASYPSKINCNNCNNCNVEILIR